jgi:hypothetical protein
MDKEIRWIKVWEKPKSWSHIMVMCDCRLCACLCAIMRDHACFSGRVRIYAWLCVWMRVLAELAWLCESSCGSVHGSCVRRPYTLYVYSAPTLIHTGQCDTSDKCWLVCTRLMRLMLYVLYKNDFILSSVCGIYPDLHKCIICYFTIIMWTLDIGQACTCSMIRVRHANTSVMRYVT